MLATSGKLGIISEQPYTVMSTLDSKKYIFGCDTVYAIDRFLMRECGQGMTSTQKNYVNALVSFEDDVIAREDMAALDALLTEMAITGKECMALQGEFCG